MSSNTGAITITGDTVAQNAHISTSDAATLSVTADAGTIVMASDMTSTNDTGAINYTSAQNMSLEALTTQSGAINVTATEGEVGIHADMTSNSGAITINGNTVAQNAHLTTSSTGTLSVTADTGDITLATGVGSSTTTGTLSYWSAQGMTLDTSTSLSRTSINNAPSFPFPSPSLFFSLTPASGTKD